MTTHTETALMEPGAYLVGIEIGHVWELVEIEDRKDSALYRFKPVDGRSEAVALSPEALQTYIDSSLYATVAAPATVRIAYRHEGTKVAFAIGPLERLVDVRLLAHVNAEAWKQNHPRARLTTETRIYPDRESWRVESETRE